MGHALILVFVLSFGFGVQAANAEQSDSISKKCETASCYSCCIATSAKETKEAYSVQPTEVYSAPAGDAVKANN